MSLLLIAAPSVLAEPSSYHIDPAIELVLKINGSNADGQVFHVGETLDFDGMISSVAYISGDYYLEASLEWDLILLLTNNDTVMADVPGGRSADNEDSEDNYALAQASDVPISLNYTFTTPGEYIIFLNSSGYVSQWESEEEPPWEADNFTQIPLRFTVLPNKTADLITEGGHHPADVGDLKVTYADGRYNVEYLLDAPWEIVNTQVYIGTNPPTKSDPKKFPYTAGEIDFSSAPPVYIAAHAQIRMQKGVDKRGKPIYVHAAVWAQTGDDTGIGKGKAAKRATYFEYSP